jgi:hypothetical protein
VKIVQGMAMTSSEGGLFLDQVVWTTLPKEQRLEPMRVASKSSEGLPRVLDSKMAWSGKQFQSARDYALFLVDKDMDDLEHELFCFKGLEIPDLDAPGP